MTMERQPFEDIYIYPIKHDDVPLPINLDLLVRWLEKMEMILPNYSTKKNRRSMISMYGIFTYIWIV